MDHPWSIGSQQLLAELNPSGATGLSPAEVLRRRVQFGTNALIQSETRSLLGIIAAQFRSILVLLLAVASGLSFAFGDIVEGFAIIAVVLINALIGFWTEFRAARSMDALRSLTNVHVTVRRAGKLSRIPAKELVPGDIVIFEGGDVVTADMRVTQASRLQANESSFTGESAPVAKSTESVPTDTILAERTGMLWKGTSITRGSGEAVVVSTGMGTELGKISEMVEAAEDEITPLEKRLDRLAHRLIWATLAVVILTGLAGVLTGKDLYLMMQTSIALAVAAIPEGLPIVATIALARGMWRMAKQNALINRLSAVETLGVTSVICTDKTGTLTENQMTLVHLSLEGEEVDLQAADIRHGAGRIADALEIGVLCNNASLDGESGVGDPLEIALLSAGAEAGIDKAKAEANHPRRSEEAFDSDVKMMATFHGSEDGHLLVAVKGAAEQLLAASDQLETADGAIPMTDEAREQWLRHNAKLAETGLRVLGLAKRSAETETADPYHNLIFLGLAGFVDPERGDVREAIAQCVHAGIRVIMVTGDQAPTARFVGLKVGLTDDPEAEVIMGSDFKPIAELSGEERDRLTSAGMFARVSPRQKLDLIELHQRRGEVVAMTGDGVNDAPALKEADIGVAMGKRGTEVAREAADMVLKDDAFSTIVSAVRQGRVIFANIRKFVIYLMSCNLAEILVVGFAAAGAMPIPLLPLQILFLNMVTDVFPALALGASEGHGEVMNEKPRDGREPILCREHWIQIVSFAALIAISTLAVFGFALGPLGLSAEQAMTHAFLVLAIAQLLHVFNLRDPAEGVFRNQLSRNRYIWIALALCAAILAAAVFVPPFAAVLHLHPPNAAGWLAIALGSIAPLFIGQLTKEALHARTRNSTE
ncbi:MAG: Ca2+-transporting ATPase [Verrucomicrobiales bacterium]|jgi:Ca2+-transporting ATPase